MAAMTGKKKGLLIAAAVLLVIVGVFCGILFGTELIQQKVIELMCPDTPSSTPRDYDAITAGTSLKTIEYTAGQQADVIAPKEGASSNIVVVYFHGGYYVGGGRHNQEPYCRYLASNGYTVLNCDYTLATEEKWPAQIKDAAAAFEYAATAFEGASLVVAGDSAGGHLAGLTACIQKSPALQALYGVQPLKHAFTALAIVHGVCDVYRFAFLRPPLDQAVSREYQKLLFGPRWKLSPLYGHASFEDTAPGLDLPPILVIASEPDRYYRQSRRLIDYLDRSTWEHEVILWKREQGERLTHVFEVGWWDWTESRETNRRMLDFFDRAAGKR